MIEENKHYVFVYGSLKKGFHNHDVLGKSRFVIETTTKKKYFMFSMGSFPAVTKKKQEHLIQGEVYKVNDKTLKALDHLEGEGSFYKKELINVARVKEPVWMYFILGRDYLHLETGDHIKPTHGMQIWN